MNVRGGSTILHTPGVPKNYSPDGVLGCEGEREKTVSLELTCKQSADKTQ